MSVSITQTNAGLKVFFTAVREWELTEAQARALLNSSPDQYEQFKKGITAGAAYDLDERLALLSLIYGSLKQLYSDENILLWLNNPSEKDTVWKGASPLETMLAEHKGIVMVHNYLNQLKGYV